MRELERRLIAQQSSLSTISAHNDRLTRTLKDARAQIVNLRAEVDRLGAPPNGYGVVLGQVEDGSVDILTAGRKMRVAVAPSLANSAIALFKDTSLVTIVSLYELTGSLGLALSGDAQWRPFYLEAWIFIAAIYWAGCVLPARISRAKPLRP